MEIDMKMTARGYVIEHTVQFEFELSDVLGKILKIDEVVQSKSLGNKSEALSFNHKINLLMDVDLIDSATRKKLKTLAEIRNKFAHDKNIRSFDDCYIALECRKFLENLYKDKIKPTVLDKNKIDLLLFNNLIKDLMEKITFIKLELGRKSFEEFINDQSSWCWSQLRGEALSNDDKELLAKIADMESQWATWIYKNTDSKGKLITTPTDE